MTITSTIVGRYITGFTVTNPGNISFSSLPNVLLSSGGGASATAHGFCAHFGAGLQNGSDAKGETR